MCIRDRLKRASEVGTDVPFDSMSFVFENRDSAIYNFQNNALKLDAFVDAEELTPIEAAVWDSIPQKNGGGIHTPFIVTPNEFVCALYSCVNSPDAPPSTEAALTIDMLRKGVSMGKRKDKNLIYETKKKSLQNEELFDSMALVGGKMTWKEAKKRCDEIILLNPHERHERWPRVKNTMLLTLPLV